MSFVFLEARATSLRMEALRIDGVCELARISGESVHEPEVFALCHPGVFCGSSTDGRYPDN